MIGADRVLCGRSPVLAGADAPGVLAEHVRMLLRADSKLDHLAPRTLRHRDALATPDMFYFGPLPPLGPPESSSPFRFARAPAPGIFVGQTWLAAWDEAMFARLWTIAAGRLGASSASIAFVAESLPRLPSVSFDLHSRRSPPRKSVRRLTIQYLPDPDHPGEIAAVVDLLNLRSHARATDLEPPGITYPGERFQFSLGDLPDRPEFGIQTMARICELPDLAWRRPARFLFAAVESRYEKLRSALNEVTGNWLGSVGAFRNPDFDPFQRPGSFGKEDLYRYPVAQRYRPSAPPDEDLGVQVDVVHTPAGSYLEFFSNLGRERLDHCARIAQVEIEHWDGPLFSRWTNPG